MFRQTLQPWLFALRVYDKLTLNGTQTPPQWPAAMQRLAGAGFMMFSLNGSMPSNVKMKYRKDLLAIQFNDFVFEIHTAWHYYLEGFNLKWYELGHKKAAEFRVRGDGLDFDVECRRFNPDVRNKIKLMAMADTCDALHKVLLERSLWGDVTIIFSDGFRFEPTQARHSRQALEQALNTGQTSAQLAKDIATTWQLQPSPSREYTLEEIEQIQKNQDEVTYILAKSNGAVGWDPIVFRCQGPRKTEQQLRDYVYTTLKNKITTQLSKTRAGVAVVKFTGVRDPNVYAKSDGMQQILRKLFNQEHLAAVVLLCDDVATPDVGMVVHSSPAIVFRSEITTFPKVAAANHLTRY